MISRIASAMKQQLFAHSTLGQSQGHPPVSITTTDQMGIQTNAITDRGIYPLTIPVVLQLHCLRDML